jgi:hypothetical protein
MTELKRKAVAASSEWQSNAFIVDEVEISTIG